MTEKKIIIKGGSHHDVLKVVRDWTDLYSENSPKGFQLELYKNGRESHIVKATQGVDNELFYYLVNYLDHPIGNDYDVSVEGFTKGENGVLKDLELLIYISETDTDHDNVYAVTNENKHFKIDFGGRIKETTDSKVYAQPKIGELTNPIILNVPNTSSPESKADKDKLKILKRFEIILIVAIAVFTLNLLVPALSIDKSIFNQSSSLLFMGVGLWFFMDYKMLRSNEFYFKSLVIALGVFCYGYYLNEYFQPNISEITTASSIYPLTLLLVQWPLRRVYKLMFGREPKVDQVGKFADLVYTMTLFLAFVVVPFLIKDYLF